ncbi:hypothetical protein CU664_28615, partial [Pseudomonas syringae pv. actinidifoliorum]|nr:hypothetical protein [Pseudomonas syringae pv. actinidifoliorum]
MERHPIQLVNITVDELYIKSLDRDFSDKNYPKEFSLTVSRSEYDSDEKAISVRLELNLAPDGNEIDRPFEMRILIAGHFEVDEDNFDVTLVDKFAEVNAPILLIPYMREQAYSLSLRAGMEPVIFPLVT